jgi:Arc/MetJ family transcription regulator
MRTTLELPDALVTEAMSITNISTKTALIKYALENVIQREKIKDLANYFGKITLDIDLDKLRKR